MAILVTKKTRVLIQVMGGEVDSFHAKAMIDYGTKVAAAVIFEKEGSLFQGVPVFTSVDDALDSTEINAAISFIPGKFAKQAILDLIRSEIPLLVITAKDIPELDKIEILRSAALLGVQIIGPGAPGIISPGKCKLGIYPSRIFKEGQVGVLSKSGPLAYEVCKILTSQSIGQSTVVGVGDSLYEGNTSLTVMKLFHNDPETKLVVLPMVRTDSIGDELQKYIKSASAKKPVIAFVAGRTVVNRSGISERGNFILGKSDYESDLLERLRDAGITIANDLDDIPSIIKKLAS